MCFDLYRIGRRMMLVVLAAVCVGADCNNLPPPPLPSTGPAVVSSPIDGMTNVATNATIILTFRQAGAPDSLAGSISPEIGFQLRWSSDNKQVVLTPDADLANSTTYMVTLSAVSFADGSSLGAPYSFSFTTIGQVTSVSDKWALWSSGTTLLRGADLHPCRVTDTQMHACTVLTTEDDVQALRNMGANVINASYPGGFDQGPPYAVNTTNQQYMDNLINWAEQIGIYVVIHPRTGPGRNEDAITNPTGSPLTTVWTDQGAHDAWIAMWRHMADRYRNSPVVIGYNLMVEPHVNTWLDPQATLSPAAFTQQHAGTLGDWNTFAAQITAAIREVDTQTPIIVDSLQWANSQWFPALVPTGDARTVYSLHAYNPDIYVAQADNAPVDYPSVVEGVNFNRDWLVEDLRPVVEFSQQHSVPIYVGEFGLFRWIASGPTFISDRIGLFEQYGWNYAYYVWRGDETEFDAYNIEYGSDRNNVWPVANNSLQQAYTDRWAQNVDFPLPTGS